MGMAADRLCNSTLSYQCCAVVVAEMCCHHALCLLLITSGPFDRPSGERVPNVERLIRELSPRVSLLTLDVKLPVRSLGCSLQKGLTLHIIMQAPSMCGLALATSLDPHTVLPIGQVKQAQFHVNCM